MGYRNERADDPNVRFAFDLALQAAREIHALAENVRSHQVERTRAADIARLGWSGPSREEFERRVADEVACATRAADELSALAGELAAGWARARGQQDRINWARWLDHDEAERHKHDWLHKAGDAIAGVLGRRHDYGIPPDDPPQPAQPGFAPTREPLCYEFEPELAARF